MSDYITVLLTDREVEFIRRHQWNDDSCNSRVAMRAFERGLGRGEMPRETTQVRRWVIETRAALGEVPVTVIGEEDAEASGNCDIVDVPTKDAPAEPEPQPETAAEPEPEEDEDDTPSIGIGRAYDDPPMKAPEPKSKALAQATGPFTVSRELCEAYIVAVVKNGDYGHVWAGVARQLDCTPAARKVVKAALLEHFKPVIDGASRGGYEGSELKTYVANQVRILTNFDGLTIDLGGEE